MKCIYSPELTAVATSTVLRLVGLRPPYTSVYEDYRYLLKYIPAYGVEPSSTTNRTASRALRRYIIRSSKLIKKRKKKYSLTYSFLVSKVSLSAYFSMVVPLPTADILIELNLKITCRWRDLEKKHKFTLLTITTIYSYAVMLNYMNTLLASILDCMSPVWRAGLCHIF